MDSNRGGPDRSLRLALFHFQLPCVPSLHGVELCHCLGGYEYSHWLQWPNLFGTWRFLGHRGLHQCHSDGQNEHPLLDDHPDCGLHLSGGGLFVWLACTAARGALLGLGHVCAGSGFAAVAQV